MPRLRRIRGHTLLPARLADNAKQTAVGVQPTKRKLWRQRVLRSHRYLWTSKPRPYLYFSLAKLGQVRPARRAQQNFAKVRERIHCTLRSCHEQHSERYHSSSPTHIISNCPIKTVKSLAFSIAYSKAKCFNTQWRHRQWRCLAERVSFRGSCGRCRIHSPLPHPTLPM
jgi:hypothetical protein